MHAARGRGAVSLRLDCGRVHFNNRRLLEGFSFRLDQLQLKRSCDAVAEFPPVWHAMSEKQVDRSTALYE